MLKNKLNKVTFVSICLFIILLIMFGANNVLAVHAAVEPANLFSNFTSKSTLLVHAESGTVLYAKNEHQKIQVASKFKLITTQLNLEKIEEGGLNLEDELVASGHATSMEGSQAFLDEGSSYSVRNLLKSVIVASANDSAVVLAEAIGGSEDGFVTLMNERAKQLNMTETKYANATGLSNLEQYSTASDTAKILREVGKYELYNQDSKIWMDTFVHPSGRETELVNTNRLVKFYNDSVNGKTGYTDEAGYCLASTATNKGLNLIAVTLNCTTSKDRFSESMELFNYGFANYENKQVLSVEKEIEQTVKIKGGKTEDLTIIPQENYYVVSKKGDKSEITLKYELNNKVFAPVKQGQVVGKCLVVKQGKIIGQVNLVSKQSVAKQTYGDAIVKLAKNWSF